MSIPIVIPSDLAPGDFASASFDWAGFEITRIHPSDEDAFETAYQNLWDEFGAKHEVEQKEVLAGRMDWNPLEPVDGYALLYEMILVEHQGRFAAVRDQTAIVKVDADRPVAVVHLSHLLVAPAWRGKGLAGWMRAWPIQTARACLLSAGLSDELPVTLVGEMEHPDAQHADRLIRLRAYEKAGFKKVDPHVVHYVQPDFRTPEVIDADGISRPLPMGLIVRRVKREHETTLGGGEVRAMVNALYKMYSMGFRAKDMAGPYASLGDYPSKDVRVNLVAPSSV